MADYTFPVIRTQHPKPKPPQDKLGFANYFTDHMFEMRYDEGQVWHDGKVIPYGPISLDPASAVLHYAQMLFEGNAKIANRYFKKQLGVLKEGAAADVIVTDYIPLTPMDASNVNGHILFGMTGRSVVTTVCNGKVLMKNRELVGLDEEKILYEVREEAKKLAHSING